MNNIKYFEEYNLNEKITWKDIKNYGEYALIALLLGYSVLPKDIKSELIKKPIEKIASYQLNSLENAINKEKINKSIDRVIKKVKNSKNIINKDFVINRLKNVKVKYLERTFFLKDIEKNVSMFYYYDNNSDNDFIIIDRNKASEEMNIILIHELNHLVDRHKIDKKNVNEKDLLSEPTLIKYLTFFEDYPKIKKDVLFNIISKKHYQDFISTKYYKNVDEISLGYYLYYAINNNRDYYLKNSEIYARLSNLKSFLIDVEIININDEITEDIINEFSKRLNNNVLKYKPNDEILDYISYYDFLIYLPIINYNNIDDINLISKNFKNKTKDFYS